VLCSQGDNGIHGGLRGAHCRDFNPQGKWLNHRILTD
jgi:hypothetical protein